MTQQALKDLLGRLHDQLEHVSDIDERQSLQALVDRIQQEIDSEEPRPSSVAAILSDWIDSMESRHPQLVSMANDIMIKLASMGV